MTSICSRGGPRVLVGDEPTSLGRSFRLEKRLSLVLRLVLASLAAMILARLESA
jgi:hypothetical protein